LLLRALKSYTNGQVPSISFARGVAKWREIAGKCDRDGREQLHA
jgi:hypothetical protein